MKPPLTVTIYQDAAYEWRFRVRARNQKQTLEPGEGYKTRAGCLRAVERLRDWAWYGDLSDACGEALRANGR